MARKKQEDCELNMTPMIDVVFQLIIFFIVTLNMADAKNEDIVLAMGPNGPEIDTDDPMASLALVIEVDDERDKKGGRKKRDPLGRFLSVGGVPMTREELRGLLQRRYNKYGTLPVMIRADGNAEHRRVRAAMDTVTECGIARIGFVAIKEKKAKD